MLKLFKQAYNGLKVANSYYQKVKGYTKVIFWLGDVLQYAQTSFAETFDIKEEDNQDSLNNE